MVEGASEFNEIFRNRFEQARKAVTEALHEMDTKTKSVVAGLSVGALLGPVALFLTGDPKTLSLSLPGMVIGGGVPYTFMTLVETGKTIKDTAVGTFKAFTK